MIDANQSVPLVVPLIGDDEISAVARVMRSGQLAQGPEVAAFEPEFAAAMGARFGVAFNSGTAAIHAALDAFDVGEGDEVVTSPFTFAASATPVLMQRAVPRFVDIDPRTFNADPAALTAAAGARTRAAIAVDLFGLPFDPSGAAGLRARGIRLIEDACQAVGAARDGARAGTLGEVAAFSLYATKNLTTGEGGFLTTDDEDVVRAARRFRQHGMTETYQYVSLGYNYRMTDVAAAIGRVQLGRLSDVTAGRRANAAFYDRALGDVPGITTPFVPAGAVHVYHQYSILVDERATPNGRDRDAVRAELSSRGIGSGVYYPKPLHLFPLFAIAGNGPGDFPVAERVARQILALPIHPSLSQAQLDSVVRALREAVGAT